MFLVLSGFLIGSALLREVKRSGAPTLWKFYTRRWFRIAPSIVSVVIATYVFETMVEGKESGCASWNVIWRFMLFIQNMDLELYASDTTCVTHTWTVAVEFQLYFVTPLVFLLAIWFTSRCAKLCLEQYITALCLVGFLVCCCSRLAVAISTRGAYSAELYFMTQNRMAPYLAGVIAGVNMNTQARTSASETACAKSSRLAASALSCSILICSTLVNHPFEISAPAEWLFQNAPWLPVLLKAFLRPALGASVAYLLVASINGDCTLLGKFLSARCWQPIAALSYSMYLFQFMGSELLVRPFSQLLAAKMVTPVPMWQAVAILYGGIILFFLGTVPFAWVNYVLVERQGIMVGKYLIDLIQRCGKPAPMEAGTAADIEGGVVVAGDERMEEKMEGDLPDAESTVAGSSEGNSDLEHCSSA
jgi:peptidoglycan/LPS O-acetylase OafA/YrhL